MKIATKTRYALRFMIDLAEHWGEGPQPMRQIAERQEVSKKYLEQVVMPLSAKGLISVSRGHMGGYELSRPPECITMADVFAATEGGLEILDCLCTGQTCERADSCHSIHAWGGLQQAIIGYLSSQTLKDLAEG